MHSVERVDESREFSRGSVELAGTLFCSGTPETPCQILDISAGGVGVRCGRQYRLGTALVLYIEGFGRYDCILAGQRSGRIGLHFILGYTARANLVARLEMFRNRGDTAATRMRRHARLSSISSAFLVRRSGHKAACDILDISLQGVSVRTLCRPPVGEIVQLDSKRGRVARHHENGFAIYFMNVVTRSDEFHSSAALEARVELSIDRVVLGSRKPRT